MATSIGDLIRRATRFLEERGLSESRLDSEVLLAHILERDRAYLLAHSEAPVPEHLENAFWQLTKRRGHHFPIQYLTGFQEFYGRQFRVTPSVLIPRPETELLVETALQLLKHHSSPRVLELGTGSGCIAVSIACEREDVRITAVDIDPSSLAIAQENATSHCCLDRVDLLCGDLTAPIVMEKGFDLILSNPPYVGFKERGSVSPEVALYEPPKAVFSGAEGTEVIESILRLVPAAAKPQAPLALEVGFQQADRIRQIASSLGWSTQAVHNDLAGIARCLVFKHSIGRDH